ncbi:haloacid dehalogenase [Actinoplanes sp. NBRC 14428]|uniref:Putative hydrolase of the HAD superfamily n=1 Tax=Pseudosporangium ferrugineum TaxID=439699 RepID=A0A2T0SCN0_9ACTN|nr:HAD family hydrolase [Pseudosporangium ferrugineum]PRY31189.1 putative hydrolase of the HAD superfamily [Pseudosporangium ferrugineum]BCJ54684.1 haloacid dehalogenase [Actinoplanes sp. NBRC 14428]
MHRQPAQAMLIDLDGVVRRWDPAVPAAVEAARGLPAGALTRTAFSWDLLRPAVAGEITDAEWMHLVATRLPLPADEAAAAVAEWQEHRGSVDPDALALVRAARAAGRPVGLATNATDRLAGDLAALGLTGEFDAVISSSELKIHKPAPEFFARACEALKVEAPWILFVDDDDRVIRGARASKLLGFRWTGAQDLSYLRKALALPS